MEVAQITYSPVLKTCTSCRAPIALQPPQTKILLSDTGRAAWNLSMYRQGSFSYVPLHIHHMYHNSFYIIFKPLTSVISC